MVSFGEHSFRTRLLSLILLQLSSLASASAPPAGVEIDYTTGPLSQSLFVNTTEAASLRPRAALNNDFPDPTVLRYGQTMYGFGTSSRGLNVQIATRHANGAQGSLSWGLWHGADAMPRLPSWVEPRDPQVWAPNIVELSPNNFVLYFTARKNVEPYIHCVGSATSNSILGPFHPVEHPFACHDAEGGAIDAFGYLDPVTQERYVVYKVDGNNFGNGGNCNNGIAPFRPTPILLQRVSSDGITKQGPAVEILDREELDGPLVEAPSIARFGGKYFLFFSSNCYVTDMYDVSYAVADRIEGPYIKRGPLILSRTFDMHGPGGAEVTVTGQDEGYLAFHAGTVGQRLLFDGRLEYLGGTRLRFCLSSGECTEAD